MNFLQQRRRTSAGCCAAACRRIRGGGCVMHAPGQLAAYPIVPLDRLGLGLAEYRQRLEEAVIDVARGEVIETIRTGKGAHGVAVSEDGAFVFVTNIVDSTLAVIATETQTVVATFAVGAGPNGVTYRPAED